MPNETQDKAEKLLDRFVKSIGELLNDITALEVNTMVVEKITAAKFSPWEAYQAIYSISDKDYFKVKEIEDKEQQKRYRDLFEKLEKEYFYTLIDPNVKLPNLLSKVRDEKVKRYGERIEWLKQHQGQIVESDPDYIELARPILPDPTEVNGWMEIREIFKANEFLLSLRKIIELKAALDSDKVSENKIDIIYAQTVMQLDGDIITRYHKQLFQEDEDVKDLIMKIHNEGVIAGGQQWHKLLDFMVNFVQNMVNWGKSSQRSSNGIAPSENGQK